MAVSIVRTLFRSANPAVKMTERVELTMADLQAVETFLNATDHFVDELRLSNFANVAGPPHGPEMQQLMHQAQILLRYAQERVGRARHRLDGCFTADQ